MDSLIRGIAVGGTVFIFGIVFACLIREQWRIFQEARMKARVARRLRELANKRKADELARIRQESQATQDWDKESLDRLMADVRAEAHTRKGRKP